MENFSSRIKSLRTSKKISQAALASEIGISQRAISYYETGKDIPSLDVLTRLANFFDVSVDFLIGRSDDPTRR